MKLKKRNKRTRVRGSRTGGWGFRKKHKGHGNKGGFGMAGTMGQQQQKAQMIAKEAGFEKYFGRKGFTSASTGKERTEQINLQDIRANIFFKEGQKIELKEHKILGEGEGFKAEIHAKAASAGAIEKMAKAGGKIILPVVKEAKVEVKKEVKVDALKVEKKVESKVEKVKTPKKEKALKKE